MLSSCKRQAYSLPTDQHTKDFMKSTFNTALVVDNLAFATALAAEPLANLNTKRVKVSLPGNGKSLACSSAIRHQQA